MLNLDPDFLRIKAREANVPEYMIEGWINYIVHRVMPGSFCLAVLGNDLKLACAKADTTNQRALFNHVYFLYNYAPSDCWGSPEKVQSWLNGATEENETSDPEI